MNLVKTPETMQQEKQQQMQEMQQQALVEQAGQLAGTPMMDPSKNEGMQQMLKDGYDQLQNGNNQGESPNAGEEEAPPEG